MEYWRNLILSLGYISHIWGLHFRIYETYPCLLAYFCLFGWEVAVWILVEIFTRDLFPHLHWSGLKFNYELFNCNNFDIHYWSWNYCGCWHQTFPPIVNSMSGTDCCAVV